MKKSAVVFQLLVFLIIATGAAGVSQAQSINTLAAGVSKEDRAEHSEFPLKVVTFVEGGSFLANVRIRIKNLADNAVVFEGVAEGPWLFVDLPAGHYLVQGERENGDRQGERVNIVEGGKQAETALMFPDR